MSLCYFTLPRFNFVLLLCMALVMATLGTVSWCVTDYYCSVVLQCWNGKWSPCLGKLHPEEFYCFINHPGHYHVPYRRHWPSGTVWRWTTNYPSVGHPGSFVSTPPPRHPSQKLHRQWLIWVNFTTTVITAIPSRGVSRGPCTCPLGV